MNSSQSKRLGAFRIALIFLALSAMYIVFSDYILLQFLAPAISPELLTEIQSYKGLAFVLLTSVLLYILVQREINSARSYIRKLEKQKEQFRNLSLDKKKIEKRLQRRNSFIETILSHLPIGIAVNRTGEKKAVRLNKQYSRIYGWPEEEINEFSSFFEKVHPNPHYREEIQNRIINDIESGEPERMHWKGIEITTKQGEKRIIDAQNIPVPKQNLMISIVQDVTEKYESEKRLKESEQKFRAIFENSLTPIVIADDSGNFLSVNKAAEDAFGYSQQELLQMKIDDLSTSIPPDTATRYQEFLEKKQEKGEFNFIGKSGEEHTIMYQAIRIAENFNLSVMMDITPRIVAEHNLEESKNLLEKTINNLNEAVIVADEDRTVLMANALVENIFGYKPEEITGKSTALLHINEESFRKLAEQGKPELEKNGFFHTNYTMRRKDGNLVDTEISVTVITEESGIKSGIISVIRDITERIKNEKKLQQYQQTLQQLTTELSLAEEKQRKEIAANIHDHLSQLLVISKIRLSELFNRLQSEEDKENLNVVTGYISEALEKSRKITYDLSPPVLYEMGLVETMHWLTEKISEEQKIKVLFTTEMEEVKLPESRLILVYRAIQELTYNAVRHARPDKLMILFKEKNNYLEVSVVDNGKGFVVENLSAPRFKKGGFGLFTVRERINNLGGSFYIDSKPGFGTTVKFSVPLT